jgi:glucose-6-phosphate-specific signal transduction histidine kinase
MNGATPTPAPLGLLVRRWPERRPVVVATAIVLLAGVLAGVVVANDATTGLAFLAVVPIVLVALELGQRGGLAIALVAIGAVLVAAAFDRPELSALAVATRALVYLAAGLAAGRFSDRMRAAHSTEERLLRSGLRLSEAGRRERLAEIALSETLGTPRVIGAVVGFDGLAEVRGGVEEGTRTVVPMIAHGVHVGTIEVFHDRAPAAEELAALELLARQAAIVAENLRLLEIDAERAALESRLREVREELLDSRSGAGLLLRAEEESKRRAAEKLHEDLAQVLSAVLLGMRMLERGTTGDGSQPLKSLHAQVSRVLSDVRDVARGLRPVVLDQLGLDTALEALARSAEVRGTRVRLQVAPLPQELDGDVETAVYRLVEDAITLSADGPVDIEIAPGDGAVRVAIGVRAPSPDSLLALRARAESVGGTVAPSGPAAGDRTLLQATLPLRRAPGTATAGAPR